jgi:hypothetical protein
LIKNKGFIDYTDDEGMSSSMKKKKQMRETTVAFGRTTSIEETILVNSVEKKKMMMSPKYERSKYVKNNSVVARVMHDRADFVASPRVKQAMEFSRSAVNGGIERVSTSERVARILANAKKRPVISESVVKEEEKAEDKEENKVSDDDVVVERKVAFRVADLVKKSITAIASVEERKVEELNEVVVVLDKALTESNKVLKGEEEEDNEGKKKQAAAELTQSDVVIVKKKEKKTSFKSLANASQSIFWLKKCNAAIAKGDEAAAIVALRTGITRKAEPIQELSNKLKELVELKMNEAAIEASKCPAVEQRTPPPKEDDSVVVLVKEEEEKVASASSSEEFEFQTIKKTETAEFVKAFEAENQKVVSEAMLMLIRESPDLSNNGQQHSHAAAIATQTQQSSVERALEYGGDLSLSPPIASNEQEFAFRVVEESTKMEEWQADASTIPQSSPLTIFARLMGKMLTDTIDTIENGLETADNRIALSARRSLSVDGTSDIKTRPSFDAIMNSPHISPRSPIRRQHSLDMKRYYESNNEADIEKRKEVVKESSTTPRTNAKILANTSPSPSKTPWSQLKKVRDIQTPKSTKNKKSTSTRKQKIDR